MITTASSRLYGRALEVMPGGCSRNTILRKPHPIYADWAKGCYVTDVEGQNRIDFANNVASLIHGHCFSPVVNAVRKQMGRGSAYTVGTEEEIEHAELLVSRSESFEKIRFVNSGTEAVMTCIKAARAFTGRGMIAKVEGSYHGAYDHAEVSQTASPQNWGSIDAPASSAVSRGTPDATLNDVVVIPFNDLERSLAILDAYREQLACILVDLIPHRVGLIPANSTFIEGLSKWAADNGSLFVVDEVITYRTNLNGAQANYNIKPDLTALGKMIGGGFPVGAIAGSAAVMDVMNPLSNQVLFPHYGTFNANPITMTAGRVAMRAFDEAAVISLNQLGDLARQQLSEAISAADVAACVTGAGSMFRLHLKPIAPRNYREAYLSPKLRVCLGKLLEHCFDNGLLMIETGAGMLSTPMTTVEIEKLTEVIFTGLKKIKPQLDEAHSSDLNRLEN